MLRKPVPHKDRAFYLTISLLVLLLNLFPFILAAQAGGRDFLFNGFLLNPVDGVTYLAKMYMGYRGEWRFALPYTPNAGTGIYLTYGFYLFLGHLARWTGWSLAVVFTLARLLGGAALLSALHGFFSWLIPDARPRRIAFALAALGSGLGWVLIPTGAFTSDFWVAETYPFLSIYDNPHFPLGLALVLWILMCSVHLSKRWKAPLIAFLTFLLSIINPFGVVIVVLVMGVWLFVLGFPQLQRKAWREILNLPHFVSLFWIGMSSVSVLYQFWAIRTDPVLAGWNAQNFTPTPPWWDVLLSLSPTLFLALAGARKTRPDAPTFLMTLWMVIGLLLIFTPFSLQRRFLMGLYVPLAGLAALGVEALARGKRSRVHLFVVSLFLFALPTNLIILFAGQTGVQTHDLALYRTREEDQAFHWLEAHTSPNALLLASPETGLLIPAFTGRQVIYGHPFETVNAKVEEQTVLNFFQTMTASEAYALLADRGVDYVFYGPRERSLGDLPLTADLIPVYKEGSVQIYAFGEK